MKAPSQAGRRTHSALAFWCVAAASFAEARSDRIPSRSRLPNGPGRSVAWAVPGRSSGKRAARYMTMAGAPVWFDFSLTVPYKRLIITRHTDARTMVRQRTARSASWESAGRAACWLAADVCPVFYT